MELIRKLASFGAPVGDLKQVYITLIRIVCEQSSSVWHSSLTTQNEEDLERIQKVAFKLILKEKYESYENAQNILELPSLKDRRNDLCLTFARKCLGNDKMKDLFPANNRTHSMIPQYFEHFQVIASKTERLKKSPIIFMQNLLNQEIKRKIDQNRLWSD